MLNKLFVELFQAKQPRGYTGRHRAPSEPRQLDQPAVKPEA